MLPVSENLLPAQIKQLPILLRALLSARKFCQLYFKQWQLMNCSHGLWSGFRKLGPAPKLVETFMIFFKKGLSFLWKVAVWNINLLHLQTYWCLCWISKGDLGKPLEFKSLPKNQTCFDWLTLCETDCLLAVSWNPVCDTAWSLILCCNI
jgi:hypothetical protein